MHLFTLLLGTSPHVKCFRNVLVVGHHAAAIGSYVAAWRGKGKSYFY